MSISLPTGDQKIDMLLAELTTLVGKHGKSSFQVEQFLETHQDDSWTDRFTGHTHYFSEIGETLAELMEGITNLDENDEEESDPADWWKADISDDESWKS